MGSLLIIVVSLILTGVLGYLIGRQRQALDVTEANVRADRAEKMLARARERLNYVQAENDHWQRRVRQLEAYITKPFELDNRSPLVLKAADARQLVERGIVPEPSAPGPKEPPTPKNHKEVG